MHFQQISVTLTECDGFLPYYVQWFLNLKEKFRKVGVI